MALRCTMRMVNKSYVNQIKNLEVLPQDKEKELIMTYKNESLPINERIHARNELLMHNQVMILKLIKMHGVSSKSDVYMELVSECNLRLIYVLNCIDMNKYTSLYEYSKQYISRCIKDYLYYINTQLIKHSKNTSVDIVSTEDTVDIGDKKIMIIDLLESNLPSPDEELIRVEFRESLHRCIDDLKDKHEALEFIINLKSGLNDDNVSFSNTEIGRLLGVSKQVVSSRYQYYLKKLRNSIVLESYKGCIKE